MINKILFYLSLWIRRSPGVDFPRWPVALWVMLFLPQSILAATDSTQQHPAYYRSYQQQQLQYDDPIGDVSLMHVHREAYKLSLWIIMGQKHKFEAYEAEIDRVQASLKRPYPRHPLRSLNAPQIPAQIPPDGPVIEGRKNPLHRERLLQTFATIIESQASEGITPTVGRFHTWSDEYHRDHGTDIRWIKFSKLLTCLSIGGCWKYMVTDRETELFNLLMASEPSSVTLGDIFALSYRINRGDVYLTLLTINNVLSMQWLELETRQWTPVNLRLAPITNHYQDRGDQFGAWYHFWGTTLYSYVKGQIKGAAIANVEIAINQVQHRFRNQTQEKFMNRHGSWLGANLRQLVEQKSWRELANSGPVPGPGFYMNLGEDFRDRQPYDMPAWLTFKPHSQFVSGHHKKSYSQRYRSWVEVSSPLRSASRCRLEIIPDNGLGFDARDVRVFTPVKVTPDQPLQLPMGSSYLQRVRLFVYDCEFSD